MNPTCPRCLWPGLSRRYCVLRSVPATVAAITAGGIAAPLIATNFGVSPELMVIAVVPAALSSHVNDPGFWLFAEYFTIGDHPVVVGAGNHYLSLRPATSAAGMVV